MSDGPGGVTLGRVRASIDGRANRSAGPRGICSRRRHPGGPPACGLGHRASDVRPAGLAGVVRQRPVGYADRRRQTRSAAARAAVRPRQSGEDRLQSRVGRVGVTLPCRRHSEARGGRAEQRDQARGHEHHRNVHTAPPSHRSRHAGRSTSTDDIFAQLAVRFLSSSEPSHDGPDRTLTGSDANAPSTTGTGRTSAPAARWRARTPWGHCPPPTARRRACPPRGSRGSARSA
jgi:hypothetical protein